MIIESIDNPDNLVDFAALKDEAPIVPRRRWQKSGGEICWHRSVEIDDDRCVFCRACGAQLDPAQVLWQMANNHERFRHYLKQFEGITKRLTDGKAEEERLKARIARARRTLKQMSVDPDQPETEDSPC